MIRPNLRKILEIAVEQGIKSGLQECHKNDTIQSDEQCYKTIHRHIVDELEGWLHEQYES